MPFDRDWLESSGGWSPGIVPSLTRLAPCLLSLSLLLMSQPPGPSMWLGAFHNTPALERAQMEMGSKRQERGHLGPQLEATQHRFCVPWGKVVQGLPQHEGGGGNGGMTSSPWSGRANIRLPVPETLWSSLENAVFHTLRQGIGTTQRITENVQAIWFLKSKVTHP